MEFPNNRDREKRRKSGLSFLCLVTMNKTGRQDEIFSLFLFNTQEDSKTNVFKCVSIDRYIYIYKLSLNERM